VLPAVPAAVLVAGTLVIEADGGCLGVVIGRVRRLVQRGVVTLVGGQVAIGFERLGDVRAVEEEVEVAVPDVLLVPPGTSGEARVARAPDGHTLGVHGLPHRHLEVGVVQILSLVRRALELNASGHGNVGIGILVVHARTSLDGIHGREELVEEGVIG